MTKMRPEASGFIHPNRGRIVTNIVFAHPIMTIPRLIQCETELAFPYVFNG